MNPSLNETAISVRGLNKSYTIAHQAQKHSTVAEAMLDRVRHPFRREERETFNALQDVSFDIKKGEVVGIIGRNGAGKSTLLKILSRITEPTSGEIDIYGRLGSLLEVGTGFHPELTGRENIYLNGAILGMRRHEITRQFDAIVDFSGVEKFLDTPVKRYSSGMYVRLAFAVAAHLDSDILIVDEVLAVGDTEFQRKCLGKMQDVASVGRTVLFVSHNMGAVKSLCSRAILLRQGKLVLDGSVDDAVAAYLSYLVETAGRLEGNPERSGSGEARMTSVELLDESGAVTSEVIAGTDVSVKVRYARAKELPEIDVIATLFNDQGVPMTSLSNRHLGVAYTEVFSTGEFTCRLPRLPLLPGSYRLAIALQCGGTNLDLVPNALMINVSGSDFFPSGRVPDPKFCTFLIDQEWAHSSASDATARAAARLTGHELFMQTINIWPQPRSSRNDAVRLSARVEIPGEKSHELWFEVAQEWEASLSTSADAFAIATLMLAASRKADLHVHGTVSPSLLRNLEEISLIWSLWKPDRYSPIKVTAESETEETPTHPDEAISCFSGGVDGSFTAFRHAKDLCGRQRRNLTAGLLVHGFDMAIDEMGQFERACAGAEKSLRSLNLPLVRMRTNLRQLGINWEDSSGSAMAASLSFMKGRFGIGLMGSTETYDFWSPFGSTPLIDPMFSSDTFRLVHDGAGFARNQKVQLVSQWAAGMQNLRVCWEGSDPSRNCGRCEKCVRTILNFRVVGAGLPDCFDSDVADAAIARVPIRNAVQMNEFVGILQEAHIRGLRDEPWVQILDRRIARARRGPSLTQRVKARLALRTRLKALQHHLRKEGSCAS